MASGFLYPWGIYPVTSGKVWGAGLFGSGPHTVMPISVMASLNGDATVKCRWDFPKTLPTGQLKLSVLALAAVTGAHSAKINPKWASVAVNETESPDGFTMNAEGTTTITWGGSGGANEFKETIITLDADTPVAGEVLCMEAVFETSSWTVDVISGYNLRIFWE
jgi:hypothetical protein